jgi:hypothetical protein
MIRKAILSKITGHIGRDTHEREGSEGDISTLQQSSALVSADQQLYEYEMDRMDDSCGYIDG